VILSNYTHTINIAHNYLTMHNFLLKFDTLMLKNENLSIYYVHVKNDVLIINNN
jgi:hypothetical protein